MPRAALRALVLLALFTAGGAPGAGPGEFEGRIVVEWQDDDPFAPAMRLAAPFSYRQAGGKLWAVPSGHVLGSDIVPPLFQERFGSPYRGNARKSFVVYSYAAATMTEPWMAAQRMFLEAALAEGVPPTEAQAMYAVLRVQGPRWETPDSSCFGNCHRSGTPLRWWPGVHEDRVDDFLISVAEPGIAAEEIDRRAEAVMRGRGPHQAW